MPGSKTLVLVEKGAGPNSVNDVVQNCADGDATRCVRVYDPDEDWSHMVLVTLAKGKSQPRREVDSIKKGQTSGVSHTSSVVKILLTIL